MHTSEVQWQGQGRHQRQGAYVLRSMPFIKSSHTRDLGICAKLDLGTNVEGERAVMLCTLYETLVEAHSIRISTNLIRKLGFEL